MADVGHELELARLHREPRHDERERETTRPDGDDDDERQLMNNLMNNNPAIRHWSTTSPPKLALWTCSAVTPPLRRHNEMRRLNLN